MEDQQQSSSASTAMHPPPLPSSSGLNNTLKRDRHQENTEQQDGAKDFNSSLFELTAPSRKRQAIVCSSDTNSGSHPELQQQKNNLNLNPSSSSLSSIDDKQVLPPPRTILVSTDSSSLSSLDESSVIRPSSVSARQEYLADVSSSLNGHTLSSSVISLPTQAIPSSPTPSDPEFHTTTQETEWQNHNQPLYPSSASTDADLPRIGRWCPPLPRSSAVPPPLEVPLNAPSDDEDDHPVLEDAQGSFWVRPWIIEAQRGKQAEVQSIKQEQQQQPEMPTQSDTSVEDEIKIRQKLQRQMQSLTADRDQLQERLRSVTSDHEQLKQQLESLTSHRNQLTALLEAAKPPDALQEMMDQRDSLRTENLTLARQLTEANDARQDAEQKAGLARQLYKDASDAARTAMADSSEMQDKMDHLQRQLTSSTEAHRQRYRVAHASWKEEERQLRGQLQLYKSQAAHGMSLEEVAKIRTEFNEYKIAKARDAQEKKEQARRAAALELEADAEDLRQLQTEALELQSLSENQPTSSEDQVRPSRAAGRRARQAIPDTSSSDSVNGVNQNDTSAMPDTTSSFVNGVSTSSSSLTDIGSDEFMRLQGPFGSGRRSAEQESREEERSDQAESITTQQARRDAQLLSDARAGLNASEVLSDGSQARSERPSRSTLFDPLLVRDTENAQRADAELVEQRSRELDEAMDMWGGHQPDVAAGENENDSVAALEREFFRGVEYHPENAAREETGQAELLPQTAINGEADGLANGFVNDDETIQQGGYFSPTAPDARRETTQSLAILNTFIQLWDAASRAYVHSASSCVNFAEGSELIQRQEVDRSRRRRNHTVPQLHHTDDHHIDPFSNDSTSSLPLSSPPPPLLSHSELINLSPDNKSRNSAKQKAGYEGPTNSQSSTRNGTGTILQRRRQKSLRVQVEPIASVRLKMAGVLLQLQVRLCLYGYHRDPASTTVPSSRKPLSVGPAAGSFLSSASLTRPTPVTAPGPAGPSVQSLPRILSLPSTSPSPNIPAVQESSQQQVAVKNARQVQVESQVQSYLDRHIQLDRSAQAGTIVAQQTRGQATQGRVQAQIEQVPEQGVLTRGAQVEEQVLRTREAQVQAHLDRCNTDMEPPNDTDLSVPVIAAPRRRGPGVNTNEVRRHVDPDRYASKQSQSQFQFQGHLDRLARAPASAITTSNRGHRDENIQKWVMQVQAPLDLNKATTGARDSQDPIEADGNVPERQSIKNSADNSRTHAVRTNPMGAVHTSTSDFISAHTVGPLHSTPVSKMNNRSGSSTLAVNLPVLAPSRRQRASENRGDTRMAGRHLADAIQASFSVPGCESDSFGVSPVVSRFPSARHVSHSGLPGMRTHATSAVPHFVEPATNNNRVTPTFATANANANVPFAAAPRPKPMDVSVENFTPDTASTALVATTAQSPFEHATGTNNRTTSDAATVSFNFPIISAPRRRGRLRREENDANDSPSHFFNTGPTFSAPATRSVSDSTSARGVNGRPRFTAGLLLSSNNNNYRSWISSSCVQSRPTAAEMSVTRAPSESTRRDDVNQSIARNTSNPSTRPVVMGQTPSFSNNGGIGPPSNDTRSQLAVNLTLAAASRHSQMYGPGTEMAIDQRRVVSAGFSFMEPTLAGHNQAGPSMRAPASWMNVVMSVPGPLPRHQY
ncbi:unnamed protein product [Sympodiomycopsis kandeliae]